MQMLYLYFLQLCTYSYENDDSHESSPMTQALPPRLFCDICDVFDQHDTDDCPLQANELEQLESHTQYHGHRGAERPYCETCEGRHNLKPLNGIQHIVSDIGYVSVIDLKIIDAVKIVYTRLFLTFNSILIACVLSIV